MEAGVLFAKCLTAPMVDLGPTRDGCGLRSGWTWLLLQLIFQTHRWEQLPTPPPPAMGVTFFLTPHLQAWVHSNTHAHTHTHAHVWAVFGCLRVVEMGFLGHLGSPTSIPEATRLETLSLPPASFKASTFHNFEGLGQVPALPRVVPGVQPWRSMSRPSEHLPVCP